MRHIDKIFIVGLIFCITIVGLSKSNIINNYQNKLLAQNKINNKQYKYFELPDKILLIDKGKIIKTVTSNDNLYNQVLDLSNERFVSNLYPLKCISTAETLKTIEEKEMVLEFIYQEPKHTQFYDQFLPPIKQYVKLLMPLTESETVNLYIDDGKGSPLSPLSNLLPPKDIINLLN
ncbi:hypothetical protein [Candidatus Clostridium radicumherbarum]|uniref:GerMN domain-containing protein n=1 Tax=Candidatus Clostridium radicumherbarum TaxID=3381662 RepID=A0ABW8TTZ9_9CLOT